jgi:peptidoglycan/LPS O-acetylase OafA/YrhL
VAGAPETRGTARLTVGDPLRALAALSVIAVHLVATLPATAGFAPTPANYEAVMTPAGLDATRALHASILLLFVLSGYLIARPFAHALVDGLPAPALSRYLRNRILRIVPLLWVVATFLLIAEWGFGWISVFATSGSGTSPIEAVALLGFMQNAAPHSAIAEAQLGPAWTLHVELAFYLLLPAAAGLVAVGIRGRLGPAGRARAVVGLCALIAVASLLAVGAAGATDPRALEWFATNAYAFMPGVALAALEPRLAPRVAAGGAHRLHTRALVAVAGAVLVAYALVEGRSSVALDQALGTVAVALLLLACLVKQWSGDGAWRALDNRVMHWVGERSYSVYLVHGTVIAVVYSLASGQPRAQLLELALLTYAGTLALSALTYRYVERPFLRRRHHVEVEPAAPAVTSAA